MQRTIELQEQQVSYTLRQSKRSRRLRLAIAPGGAFTVSAPLFLGTGMIERFIQSHAEWILDKLARLSHLPVRRSTRERKQEYLAYKEAARTLVMERLAHFNRVYGFRYARISIRDQKTRWGSCSRQGNLSFNYRVALLAPELADYIIVHELCHLGAFDHSTAFWKLVARTVPDHRACRRALRDTAYQLD